MKFFIKRLFKNLITDKAKKITYHLISCLDGKSGGITENTDNLKFFPVYFCDK